MVESTSGLPKCSRRCAARCTEARGNLLTNALLTRRRRHKTVHFGDLTERLGAYCTDIPNCCKLSSICRNGGDASRSCPICLASRVPNASCGVPALQQGALNLPRIVSNGNRSGKARFFPHPRE
ncbi:UNVERIFIED_CONTAM: hypothetical protein PYX00_009309 [Menopon gallinae]|uniref:Uncharacterized protein n=1 Tax=Menopon gallinae TaxID=328185 RepID=A0AAW2HAY3_9NEOP